MAIAYVFYKLGKVDAEVGSSVHQLLFINTHCSFCVSTVLG